MTLRLRVPRRGFTLIEILVVIVVIAILAALVAPNVFRHVGSAKDAAARAQIELLGAALDAYRLDNGRYPTTARGLEASWREPTAPNAADSLMMQVGRDGVFWGRSDDGVAWLLYLRPSSRSGAIYGPSRSTAICDVQVGKADSITFHSAVRNDGTRFHFTGRVAGTELAGTLSRVRRRTGEVTASNRIVLLSIRARFLTDTSDDLSGEYMAARISEMSGDIYGIGVVIADAHDGLVGLSVEWEGGPAWPQPLGLERWGDTLQFTWTVPTGTSVDTAVVHGDTLRFLGGALRLVKQSRLRDVFARADRSTCR